MRCILINWQMFAHVEPSKYFLPFSFLENERKHWRMWKQRIWLIILCVSVVSETQLQSFQFVMVCFAMMRNPFSSHVWESKEVAEIEKQKLIFTLFCFIFLEFCEKIYVWSQGKKNEKIWVEMLLVIDEQL